MLPPWPFQSLAQRLVCSRHSAKPNRMNELAAHPSVYEHPTQFLCTPQFSLLHMLYFSLSLHRPKCSTLFLKQISEHFFNRDCVQIFNSYTAVELSCVHIFLTQLDCRFSMGMEAHHSLHNAWNMVSIQFIMDEYWITESQSTRNKFQSWQSDLPEEVSENELQGAYAKL